MDRFTETLLTWLGAVVVAPTPTGTASEFVARTTEPLPADGLVTPVIDSVTLSPAAMVLGTATLMMEPFPAMAAESPLLPPPLPEGFV